MLNLGSLFDGIGVFPLAAVRSGITPLWASEIEKASCAITKRHFPQMAHLGDITKLHGAELPPVDVITFGSPCQNLSAVGFREGLAGIKSSLFYCAIRIIEEMRCATNGLYPTIAIWENVMGAFSSNNRMDFRAVLQSFANTEISMPPTGRWATAGMVRGGGVDIAWRCMDAQLWGRPALPQRRKRIFVVADFRGQRAAEILFKPRDMQPHPAPCRNGGLSSTHGNRISLAKAGRPLPIIHPIQERSMRGAVKAQYATRFVASFGKPDEPFPTLLARNPVMFAFWYEGAERDGHIRYLTPTECERIMGLPDGWTAFGADSEAIPENARYRALGNSIALPCADYLMTGVAEVLKGGGLYE